MRDAIGGVFNIQFVLIFIVLVSSYLAFSVNYTKAFRAKNKIIDIYEAYGSLEHEDAKEKILSYLNKIGYNPVDAMRSGGQNIECSSPGATGASNQEKVHTGVSNMFMYCVYDGDSDNTAKKKQYIEVITLVSVDVPLIRNLLARFSFFHVRGSSKTIYLN